MEYKCEKISPYTVELGEGAYWCEKSAKLYHVDLIKGGAWVLDPVTKAHDSCYFEPGLTLIIPFANEPDKFLITQNQTVCCLEWSTKKVTPMVTVDEGKDTRANDGKCDLNGRLWFGTMNWERQPGVFKRGLGSLYLMDKNRKITMRQDKLTIPNGLTWSIDNKKFYFIDSTEKQIWLYDYDHETGAISNRKTIFDYKNQANFVAKEIPDGMTIDCHDKIWVASFHGSSVYRIDPETGKLLSTIKFPTQKITDPVFGGPDYRTLYVTSAHYGSTPEQLKSQPDAGAVFAINFEKENIRGGPCFPYKGK